MQFLRRQRLEMLGGGYKVREVGEVGDGFGVRLEQGQDVLDFLLI